MALGVLLQGQRIEVQFEDNEGTRKGMKVLAGIVLFKPDIARLKDNITAIRDQVDEIVLVDNGSDNLDDVKAIFGDEVKYIENGENLGIAAALNKMMDYGLENGFQWVVTLDQDSVCNPGLVDEYKKFADIPDAGMITCRIMDRNTTGDEIGEEQEEDCREIKRCITSASFCSVKAYRSVGPYDEWMFIDWVDFEYCARLRKNGYKIYRVNFVGMIHEIGHGRNVRLIREQIFHNHSAFRQYYIARNRLYVAYNYPEEYSLLRERWHILVDVLLITFYGDNKREKIKAMSRGVSDFKKFRKEHQKQER